MHRTFSYARTLTGLIAAGAVAAAFTGCSGDGFDPPVGNPTVTMTAEPPPPISGGTLLVTADGRTAVAGDPDRHGIWVVDLSGSDIAFLPVGEREEPGRVVEDGQGRAHVALRRGGAVVTVDVAARAIVDRRDVCVAPSGLAYDAAADALHVACMGGELVTLPAAGGAATRKLLMTAHQSLGLLVVILAVAGMADGVYLSLVHVDYELGKPTELAKVCSQLAPAGCLVTTGRFGSLLGIPVALWGLGGAAATAVVAGVAFVHRRERHDPWRGTTFALGAASVLASITMAMLSSLEGSYCPFCVLWYGINLGIGNAFLSQVVTAAIGAIIVVLLARILA